MPGRSLALWGALLVALQGCPAPDEPPVDAGATDAGPEMDAGRVDGGADGGDAGAPDCTTGSDDDAAPRFEGLAAVTPDGPDAVILTWEAASDDRTRAEELRYLIFVSGSPGQELSSPDRMVRGQTRVRIDGLSEGATYYFVVRARDGAGQVECNEVERSASPGPITGCVDYAMWIQPTFDRHCVRCHGPSRVERALRLDSWAGARAGGASGAAVVPCAPELSLLHLKSSEHPPQGHRMPYGGPYLNGGEVERIRLWIEQGAAESCAAGEETCADETPPAFAGLASATQVGGAAELCWEPGADDTTAPEALVYDVFTARGPGGHDLDAWTRPSSDPGARCVTFEGLTPGEEYCWVVRARDEAGNRDDNTVERCLTVPAAGCVDYETVVQPILERECVHCHGGTLPISDLDLSSHASLLEGGSIGSPVVACDAAASFMIQKISEAPPFGARMPADGPPHLSPAEAAALTQWIDEGARASCAAPDPC